MDDPLLDKIPIVVVDAHGYLGGGVHLHGDELLIGLHSADGSPASALVIDAFVNSFQATMLVGHGHGGLLITAVAALP